MCDRVKRLYWLFELARNFVKFAYRTRRKFLFEFQTTVNDVEFLISISHKPQAERKAHCEQTKTFRVVASVDALWSGVVGMIRILQADVLFIFKKPTTIRFRAVIYNWYRVLDYSTDCPNDFSRLFRVDEKRVKSLMDRLHASSSAP